MTQPSAVTLNSMTHQLSQTKLENNNNINNETTTELGRLLPRAGYQDYMHPSSNLSPISPSFPNYSRPHHQVIYNNNSNETALLSPTSCPYPNGFPALRSNVENGMQANLESHGNGRIIPPRLNLSHSAFRHDPMFSPFQMDMRRSDRSDNLIPSPAIRPPMNSAVHPPGNHPFDPNNHLPHPGMMHPGMPMYSGGPQSQNQPQFPPGYGPTGTPLLHNDQLKFLAQNPQYLSGLAGQALGNSGKISRAIAAQLFARDENTDRFPCTLCGQSFKRINGLKRHLMMHLHIKPYKCDMCGRGFCRIDVFKRHVARARCLKEA